MSDRDRPVFSCSFCDDFKLDSLPPRCLNLKAKTEAYASLENLVRLPSFRESKRPRIFAMMALRRFAKHSIDADFLDMEVSRPAFWCFQSLSSSIRELRIAAGYILTRLIRDIGANFSADGHFPYSSATSKSLFLALFLVKEQVL
jgi:serine/threonine-protein kinase ATR